MQLLALMALTLSQSGLPKDATSPSVDQPAAVPVVVEFTIKEPKKITDKRHPEYVRCRTKAVIGSLAKKRRVCMTNQQWKIANLEGSKRSQELVDDLQVGMNNNGL